MDRVNVGRYKNPESVGFLYWVETPDWILFKAVDGRLYVSNSRDPISGAVQGEMTII